MAEREGLCSLTLRIPLPLATGALATDWQPDGLRPSAVFVSQRLASKLAAGKQIQPAACAAGCPGCGEGGIRTPGAFQLNSFQDCRNRPLYHLSNMSNPRKAVLTKQPTRSISRIGSAKVINLNKCTKKLYGYPQKVIRKRLSAKLPLASRLSAGEVSASVTCGPQMSGLRAHQDLTQTHHYILIHSNL